MNHPILFVHGIASNGSTWGASFAGTLCQDPSIRFEDVFLQNRVSQPVAREVQHLHLSSQAIRFGLEVTCRDGRVFHDPVREEHVFDHESSPTVDVARAGLYSGSLEVSADRSELVVRYKRAVNGSVVDVVWRRPSSAFVPEWSDRNVRALDWDGRDRSNELPDERTRDLFQRYDVDPRTGDPTSAPAYLARLFGLNTSFDHLHPREGINDNGIYFYSAKRRLLAGCVDPEAVLDNVVVGGLIEQSIYTGPTGVGYVHMVRPAVQLSYHIRCAGTEMWESPRTEVIAIPGTMAMSTPPRSSGFTVNSFNTILMTGTFTREEETRSLAIQFRTEPGGSYAPQYGSGTVSYANIGAGLDIPSVEQWELDELASPVWTTDPVAQPGQSNQLYARIAEVLDNHYGTGQWQGNPKAQIDLVCHSLGGLVTREMIAHAPDPSPSNPVNHIRRIVMVDTPNFGTSFATDADRLVNPSVDERGNLGLRPQPALAGLRRRLLAGEDPMDVGVTVEGHAKTCIKGICWTNSADVSLRLRGPLLGPYSVSADVDVLGLFDVNVYKDGALDPTQTLRDGLQQFSRDASFLAWPSQSAWIQSLLDRKYPHYPATASLDEPKRIPITTLSSSGVPGFVTGQLQTALDALRAGCLGGRAFTRKGDGGDEQWLSCDELRKGLGQIESNPSMIGLKGLLRDLDNQWSTNSDFVVDRSSQMARRANELCWQPGVAGSEGFHAEIHANGAVTHWPVQVQASTSSLPAMDGVSLGIHIPETKLSHPAATRQKCDILRALGVDEAHTSPSLPVCQEQVWMGTAGTVQALRTVVDGQANVALRVFNQGGTALRGIALDYLLRSVRPPMVVGSNLGGARLEVVPVGVNLYAARVSAPQVVVPPGGVFPDLAGVGFRIAYADTTPWDLAGEVAAPPENGTWFDVSQVVLRDAQGVVHHGAMLAAALDDSRPESEPIHLQPFSRDETNGESNISRPVLRFRNDGSQVVRGFRAYYFVRAEGGRRPVLEVWSLPWNAPGSTARLIPLGGDQWAAEIDLRGLELAPGEQTPDIKIGWHYDDWSVWDRTNDPSVSRLDGDWEQNPAILVQTEPLAWVAAPDAPADPDIASQLSVRGRDEGVFEANSLKPRLVVENVGLTTVHDFDLRFSVALDPGKMPVLESWYVPSCAGRLEEQGSGRWDAVFTCRGLELQPGSTWPDNNGMVFGLHHTDWTSWNKADDPSAAGLGESMQTLTGVDAKVVR